MIERRFHSAASEVCLIRIKGRWVFIGLLATACGGGGAVCDWEAAAAYCRKRGGRLPSAQELRLMYDEECAVGSQAEACKKWYWSSAEENSLSATGMRFYDGDMHSGSKLSGATGIRCK